MEDDAASDKYVRANPTRWYGIDGLHESDSDSDPSTACRKIFRPPDAFLPQWLQWLFDDEDIDPPQGAVCVMLILQEAGSLSTPNSSPGYSHPSSEQTSSIAKHF